MNEFSNRTTYKFWNSVCRSQTEQLTLSENPHSPKLKGFTCEGIYVLKLEVRDISIVDLYKENYIKIVHSHRYVVNTVQ